MDFNNNNHINDNIMKAQNLKRPTIGECQEVFDRYGIDTKKHNSVTTDLCAVILYWEEEYLEKDIGARFARANGDPERNWEEDFETEGVYSNTCVNTNCGKTFFGSKHRKYCKKCSTTPNKVYLNIPTVDDPCPYCKEEVPLERLEEIWDNTQETLIDTPCPTCGNEVWATVDMKGDFKLFKPEDIK